MILILFLIISLGLNGVLFWYTRKVVERLSFGVDNVDQLQKLLEEYCLSIENMLEMEQYYGDDTMVAAVKNTKLVIETCKMYKKTIMDEEEKTGGVDDSSTNE
jgi:hypothetical protein